MFDCFQRVVLLMSFDFIAFSKIQKKEYLSRDVRFSTMWSVRPAKSQINLRIGTVCPEPLPVALLFYKC